MKKMKEEKTRNKKKDKWESSWNLFKKIGSIFMDDYIYKTLEVDGYYKTDKINAAINDYIFKLTRTSEKIGKNFEDSIEEKRKNVRELIMGILQEVKNFYEDIQKQELKIKELSNSIDGLEQEIQRNEETYAWLNSLEEKIKGE